jgi:oligoribonuclease
MDDWNKNTHGKSGLLDRVRASRYDERAAELEMLNFLKPLVPARASPMCGNSICQDRRFLARLMPELEAYFHYRNLDVSTIKELARRWAPDVFKAMEKNTPHVALDDIRESIRELRYYRQHFIKS